jgi:DNA mismatch repair protein MutS
MEYTEATPVLQEYLTLHKKYQDTYGNNIALLFQIGSFHEIYESEYYHIGNAREISNVLNIQLTKKKKTEGPGPKNPLMIGFPSHSTPKFVDKLISNNYTVVKYDQQDIPGSSKKMRVLDKIYSPGTYLENRTSSTNYIVSIIIERIQNLQYAYLSAIDITTGKTFVFEVYDRKDDIDRVENEVFRFIHTINPTEILFAENKEYTEEKIKSIFKLKDIIVHFRIPLKEYKDINYQNQLLLKVYGKKKLAPIEYIGLELYPDLVHTFIFVLQFAYEHDPSIISKLTIPELKVSKNTLILNKDSIYQLNIVSNDKGKNSSIFNLINYTKTNIGSRLLKERLLLPITDSTELENRYDMISLLTKNDKYKEFQNILKNIVDLEKKHRKAILNKLTPHEFSTMFLSYQSILKLFDEDYPNTLDESVKISFRNFLEEISDTYNLTKMENMYSIKDIKISIFKDGIYENIDDIQEKILDKHNYFESIRIKLSCIADPKPKDSVKLIYNNIDGYFLQTTKKRYERIMNNINLYPQFNDLQARINKNIVKITTPEFITNSDICEDSENAISAIVQEEYIKSIYKLYRLYRNILKEINIFVAELDVICSCTEVSIKNGYHRPTITKKNCSFVKFDGIRHPLIEKIIDEEYVANNVLLGDNNKGILLYGINAAGKSSLLRSVGSNVVLAQAGMFVAARKMEYYPFNLLFSKISSSDNLFRGQSTFVSEMIELRSILKSSDINSLILADELCSGTESLSATAIMASTLIELNKRGACHLFSTHLHSLLTLDKIHLLTDLDIFHFKVDIVDGNIFYDRTIQKGGGQTLYGLEIARSLDIGSSFIMEAFAFRAELSKQSNNILSTKKSRYNSNIYVHACEHCGKEMNEVGPLHTHHKVEQELADKNGIINQKFHKNSKHNLQILCSKCHINHHQHIL